MNFTIAPIVEGYGDVAALPVLLRKMEPRFRIARPVRFPRTRLVQREHLVRAAHIASANIRDEGAILLVMDADEDCAADLSGNLEVQLGEALPQRDSRVVLAVREFETWIVGGDAAFGIGNPDAAGALKVRIRERYGVYSETADQARLISQVDCERLTQCSRSFRKLQKVIAEFAVTAGYQNGG